MRNGDKLMEEQDKFVSVIAKLNELTQEGKLTWSKEHFPENLNLGKDRPVKLVFSAFFRNKTLRIYAEEYKYWYEEDRYEWDSRIVLAFVDDITSQNIWEFPQVAGLADLYESVRYQEADVDQFIDEILSEDK
jgi:hypothetical protein